MYSFNINLWSIVHCTGPVRTIHMQCPVNAYGFYFAEIFAGAKNYLSNFQSCLSDSAVSMTPSFL